MCRLLGMTGGRHAVTVAFWLLDAPDSPSVQSDRKPDGTGLGVFDATGAPAVHKWPLAAYEDQAFAREARHVTSTSFVDDARYASMRAVERRNTTRSSSAAACARATGGGGSRAPALPRDPPALPVGTGSWWSPG